MTSRSRSRSRSRSPKVVTEPGMWFAAAGAVAMLAVLSAPSEVSTAVRSIHTFLTWSAVVLTALSVPFPLADVLRPVRCDRYSGFLRSNGGSVLRPALFAAILRFRFRARVRMSRAGRAWRAWFTYRANAGALVAIIPVVVWAVGCFSLAAAL